MALATVTGLRRQGFFIPYRYVGTVEPIGYPLIEAMFERGRPAFLELLAAAEGFADTLAAMDGPAPEPRFSQDWFPRLDAAVAYTLVRSMRPRRIVEIGSGHSTRFLARALRDSGHGGELVAIDPAPRASLAGLGARHLPRVLGDEDRALVAGLEPRDVLFVDSSHVAMPGTDVDRLVNDLLPRLRAGVLVHVHDIFLPDPYPAAWAWRGYNEQLLVAGLLTSGMFEPVWASRWFVTRLTERLAVSPLAALPLLPGALETSFWLRKRAEPM